MRLLRWTLTRSRKRTGTLVVMLGARLFGGPEAQGVKRYLGRYTINSIRKVSHLAIHELGHTGSSPRISSLGGGGALNMPDGSMSLRLHLWDCSCCFLPIFFLFRHRHRPQSLFPTSSVMSFLKRSHVPPLWTTLVLYVVVPSGRCRHAVPAVSHLLCVRSDPGHEDRIPATTLETLRGGLCVNHYCVNKTLPFSTPGQMDCFLVQKDQQLRRWPHAKLRPSTPPAGAWSSACPTCRT